MAVGWKSLVQTGKKASLPEMGTVQGETTVLSSHSMEERTFIIQG